MLDAVFRPSASGGPSAAVTTTHSRRQSGDETGVGDATVLALLEASFGADQAGGLQPEATDRSRRSSGESAGLVSQAKRSVPPLVHTDSDLQGSGPGPVSPPDAATVNYANAETHPASAAAPLEYVKLARTKGARMFKAVETRRKTYLAVLCGDTAERVELFTVRFRFAAVGSFPEPGAQGSKNVSLSLNRTFVLPETPRSCVAIVYAVGASL